MTCRPYAAHFNPRSPYGERQHLVATPWIGATFQSTLPLRGATPGGRGKQENYGDFNPRSPYGERPPPLRVSDFECHFNPRSPYGERHPEKSASPPPSNFNPRSPYGERLLVICAQTPVATISIHAPLTGSDNVILTRSFSKNNFNPRSPYGERPAETKKTNKKPIFQSTLPLRGATATPRKRHPG